VKNNRPSGAKARAVAKLAAIVSPGGAWVGTPQLFGAAEPPVAAGVDASGPGGAGAPILVDPLVEVVGGAVDVTSVVATDNGWLTCVEVVELLDALFDAPPPHEPRNAVTTQSAPSTRRCRLIVPVLSIDRPLDPMAIASIP
jgi:hypothetical protein